MKEISINDIGPIRIGQVENEEAGTGCTVFICDEGMHAGLDVRGGGPASRETQLLSPLTAAQRIHGIVLAGGSAYGLSAASGVMQYLREQDIGFDAGVTKVPLVVQSDLFDLTVGDPDVYPDETMGYEAARRAFEEPNYRDGNYGAGCGATIGKLCGMERCMKSGIGSFAVQLGELKVGAVVAVNALGDIFDWKNGRQIAGMLTEDKTAFASSPEEMQKSFEVVRNRFVENTTLGVIITNAAFHKPSLCKIAGLGHDGYARSIRPVHTSLDGDSIYAVSVGSVSADREVVGLLAAEVISEAIIRAVCSCESKYGFPSAKDFGCDNIRDQIERIKKYEEILNDAKRLLKTDKRSPLLEKKIKALEEYYDSDDWKRDYAADETGRLPEDLKRGVLSEDGIYNLLEEYRELTEQ